MPYTCFIQSSVTFDKFSNIYIYIVFINIDLFNSFSPCFAPVFDLSPPLRGLLAAALEQLRTSEPHGLAAAEAAGGGEDDDELSALPSTGEAASALRNV